MRAYDIIYKKRNGKELKKEEIFFMIEGLTGDNIPDYQVAAWMMAVFLRGMTPQEIAYLTEAMMRSGDMLDLSPIPGIKVDKHSTGGVGDKVSLILAPLVAACGVPVPMMSGRGLGHTGGTLDKLESISGYRVDQTEDEFIDIVKSVGVCIMGQTGNLAPADKKMYSLRDVTATVDSIPLISGSIMSKKFAAGPDAIVMDVKVGTGAFMKTMEDAQKLAESLVRIGEIMNRNVKALITDMNQPLGVKIGNSLEVRESIECLDGRGPEDLMEVVMALARKMLILGEKAENDSAADTILKEKLASKAALKKFRDMVAAQEGDTSQVDDPEKLPSADNTLDINSEREGFVKEINTEAVGISGMILGAGRESVDDELDYAVGIEVFKKIGSRISKGEKIATIYYNDDKKLKEAEEMLRNAFTLTDEEVEPVKMVKRMIG